MMVQTLMNGSIPAAPETAVSVLVAAADVPVTVVPVTVVPVPVVPVTVETDAVPVVVAVVPPTPPVIVVVSWEAAVGLVAATTMLSPVVDCEAAYEVEEKPQRLTISLISARASTNVVFFSSFFSWNG